MKTSITAIILALFVTLTGIASAAASYVELFIKSVSLLPLFAADELIA
jgi:hypothetical protein